MANYFTTPNMDLTVPYVNVDPGPDYANNINNSFSLIDAHDHSSGKGVQITPSGLNINAALTFNGNPLTNASYVEFQLQSSGPGVSQSLYVQNGSESPARPDLWYYDGSSAVQLTNNGSVNATIANLPGESYGAGTFTWKQGVGSTTPAAFDIGAITLRPNVAGTTNGITLQTGAISSAWTLTLPTLPSVTSFLTVDSSGNISSATALDGVLTTANLSASAGILGSQLSASAGILGSQLLGSPTIEPTQLYSGVSVSSATTVTVNSTSMTQMISIAAPTGVNGRVALISFSSTTTSGGSADIEVGGSNVSASGISGQIEILYVVPGHPGITVASFYIPANAAFPGSSANVLFYPAAAINTVHYGNGGIIPSGGNYILQAAATGSGSYVTINNLIMQVVWL